MKTIKIDIEGKEYPMRATMGALVDFKKETGRDPKDVDPDSVLDLSEFVYCCIKSTCRKDGVEFNYSFDDFCDTIDIDTIFQWNVQLNGSLPQGKNEKKTEGK